MQLDSLLEDDFSASIRQRGYQYFLRGRVSIRVGSATELGAVVVGAETYSIMLKWTRGELAVLCSCPYFIDQGENCKHLWAAILAAEEQGYLSEATHADEIVLDTESLLDHFLEERPEKPRRAGLATLSRTLSVAISPPTRLAGVTQH